MGKLLYVFIFISLFLMGCTVTPETGNDMLAAKTQCEAEPTCKAVLDGWQEEVNYNAYAYFEQQFLNNWVVTKNAKDAEQDARLDVLEAGLLVEEVATTTEPQEIYYGYNVMTGLPKANGWVCRTVDSCTKDGFILRQYNYDVIGQHKIYLSTSNKYVITNEMDIKVLFVDKYDQTLEERIITLVSETGSFVHIFDNIPIGTKLVKFIDIIDREISYNEDILIQFCDKYHSFATNGMVNCTIGIKDEHGTFTNLTFYGETIDSIYHIKVTTTLPIEKTDIKIGYFDSYNNLISSQEISLELPITNTYEKYNFRNGYFEINQFPEGTYFIKFMGFQKIYTVQ